MQTENHREPTPNVTKVAAVALVATTIEWYDFFLYGIAAALIFSKVFFPAEMTPLTALLASFGTFAVGFLARPLGGVVFGHFGDRLGRKRALVVALALMGVSTTLIGALPGYAAIGIAAPLLLVILRFAQGLAIGGQWGGAMLLAVESAPKEKRGFYGSFAQVGAPLGVILANLAVLLVSASMSDEAFMAWGWRIPFLISIVLLGVAVYVQSSLEESPEFKQLEALAKARREAAVTATTAAGGLGASDVAQEDALVSSPVLLAIKQHWREILLAAGAFIAIQVAFYMFVAFVVAYGANPAMLGLDRNMMLFAVLIGALAMIPSIFLSAMYSDRHGRRGVYLLGACMLGGWAFALFPLIDTGEFLWITLAVVVGQIFVGMMYGPQAALFAELFGTKVRYSGASLGYQVGAILGGAFAPMIATSLLVSFGNPFPIGVYISAACVVTIVSMLMIKETYQTGLSE
jgi:metabolite-proton symporter